MSEFLVLIVAECNVNSSGLPFNLNTSAVLIVAECNVN